MDVTRHNFKTLLPEIEEAIASSDFISIDGEFTGNTYGQFQGGLSFGQNKLEVPIFWTEHFYFFLENSSYETFVIEHSEMKRNVLVNMDLAGKIIVHKLNTEWSLSFSDVYNKS